MNTKIHDAVARVNQRKAKTITLRQISIAVTDAPIRVSKSGELGFKRDPKSDANEALLLIFDPKVKAFRPVLTPPGTAWELVEKKQGPQLWTPERTA